MTDKDRGTYSPPTEDSLSYETRRTTARDQAPITLIISGIFLVVLLLAVVLFYNSGLNNHGRPAPEVGDSLGDIKDAKVEDAKPLSDQDMLEPTTDTSGGATFAPGTEAPLRDQSTSQAAVDQAPPPATPIQGPLPSQANNAAITGQPAAATVPVPAAKAAATAVTPPAATAAKPVVTPVKPVVTPAATASAAATPASAVVTKPAAGAGAVVQIGAFESTDMANKEYAKVASSFGLFLGGTSKHVEKVETAKGTFYRTSFVGFASPEKAKSFCSALKASGHDCFVK